MQKITKKRKKNKLAITHVVSLYPPSVGGMQNVAYGIVTQLQKKNYNVKVITTKENGSEQFSNTKGIERYSALKIGNLILSPTAFFAGIKHKCDIAHLHLGLGMLPESYYMACKFKRIPYVVHIHIAPYKSTVAGVFLPAYMPLFKKIVRDANAVVVPTRDYVSIMANMCNVNKSKIVVIPTGIEDIFFEHCENNNTKKNDLLWVGRLCKQKNLPLLIDSFKLIANKLPHIRLNIVGDGPDRYNLEQSVIKNKLSDKVIIHGSLSQIKIRKLMRENLLLLMTSETESFGIVLIEAMSQGMPVIATDIPSVRRIVTKKTGILSPLQPKKFAGIVVSLLNNHERIEKMRIDAIIEAQNYKWSTVVKQYEKLYLKVAHVKK
jgi:glycosyltransferase involved in cell wall biosynthesis